jgi:hypothetical protein
MKKILAAVLLGTLATLSANDRLGAIANLRALPPGFQNGVLKLSADNCDPNPERWYIAAKSDAKDGGVHNFEMAAGQVLSNKPTLGLVQLLRSNKPIAIDKVVFDSRDAFDLAQRYANANQKIVASASLVLSQQGDGAVPIWSVWCYAPDGTYFGEMQILATDGTVISNDAFPKKP